MGGVSACIGGVGWTGVGKVGGVCLQGRCCVVGSWNGGRSLLMEGRYWVVGSGETWVESVDVGAVLGGRV